MKTNFKWIKSAIAILLLIAVAITTPGCYWILQEAVSDTPTSSATTADTTTSGTEATEATSLDTSAEDTTPSETEDIPTAAETTGTEATEAPTEPTEETTKPAQTDEPVSGSSFQVHFIDVGQADAALVLCDGKTMLIDGGNASDSSLMYTYLKKYGITHLDYVVGTHGHEDHIGGIAGALNYATVGTVYSPVTTFNSKAFNNFVKAVKNRGASITVPSVGTSFKLGSASVKILAVNTTADANNTSIVLRITYGSTSFLFTGDAEREVEQALLNRGTDLRSTVLKVGHHGSETSTSYTFLREIMPRYAVISVGKGNSYGHPTENVLSRLRDADTKLYRTDMQGDIICTSNGSTVSFRVSRNANVDTFGGIGGNSTQTTPTQPAETQPVQTRPTETVPPATETEPSVTEGTEADYIINKNSGLFHEPDCVSVKKMSEKNKEEYHGTREELIENGYTPCKNCDP